MVDNYINEQEVYDVAIDMVTVNQLNYAESILNKLSLSDNSKIVEGVEVRIIK